jgi:uncharacterized membrane protein (UPF0127 family)
LGRKIRVASSFVDRGLGLLLTPALGPGEGLWLEPCTSIHTFFMRYPIDALFIDAEGRVIVRQTLPPWRVSRWHRASRGVLELAAGTLAQTGTQAGDRIEFEGER